MATRAIQVGEEITLCYVDITARFDVRQRLLEMRGFICDCPACTRYRSLSEHDKPRDAREVIARIMTDLNFWADHTSPSKPSHGPLGLGMVNPATNTVDLLEAAGRFIDLLHQERITSHRMKELYMFVQVYLEMYGDISPEFLALKDLYEMARAMAGLEV